MNHIQLAAKFYNAREMAHTLLGDRYAEEIDPWKKLLQRVMEQQKVDVMAAALFCGKKVMTSADPTGLPMMFCLSACLDLVEGT